MKNELIDDTREVLSCALEEIRVIKQAALHSGEKGLAKIHDKIISKIVNNLDLLDSYE